MWISILTLTPALFRRFMRVLPPGTDLSSVKKLRIGADVMTVADVDAWRARFPRTTTLERAFNATEAGMVLHMSIEHDTPIPGPLVPMGKPVSNVDVWLIDEAGNEVPDGETGELVVRSPNVVHGYWNASELTAEKFTFDPERPDTPTFRTGDLVRRGSDGLYYFIGRRDSRLKIHGRRIDPLEVESALCAHAGVREAAAIAQSGPDGEARLVAYAVTSATPRELRKALRGTLPAWMIPARIYVVDALPMTASGKVDRVALAQRIEPLEQVELDATEDLEQTLRAIWSRVLGMSVRVDDDFFDELGGDSLNAAEIVAEVSRVTGRSLPLSLLLELNTIGKMADYLRTRADHARTVIALQPEGSRPPLFCLAGKGGSVIVFRKLAALLGNDQPFYGITHHGIDRDSLPRTLAALAACYADAIRATQPTGPYYLAGYSAGGMVAYELARQLTRAGDRVAFLGLLDTAATRHPAPVWKRYGRYLAIFRRRPRATAWRYLLGLGTRAVWLARWFRNGGTKPFRPALPAEMIANNAYFDSLDRRATPQPYDGRVTLFLAREGMGADHALPDAGWKALCGDNLTVVPIDGEHHTIRTEDAHLLAAALKKALERAHPLLPSS
ncbi:MAG TPA: thioesterase domain-containing protein [Thermoanaerobaculia bacterium]|nr:thioesterase domain-containing protein [Thermoanaerobaculia bacterium]